MKRRVIGLLCSSALLSIMVPVGLLAHADDFDAAKTANSIFQEAQRQSVQQQNQAPATSNPSPSRSTSGNQGYYQSTPSNRGNGSTSSTEQPSDSRATTQNNIDTSNAGTPSSGYGGSNDFQYDTDDDGPSKSKINTSDASLSDGSTGRSRGSSSSGSSHRSRGLSDRQKAEIRANNYLAKVRQKLALRTAQNNDGGAWELRHSYENQLQVINNGSRTAQTRALQVQLSGELDQLQAVHDRHVDTFNNEINQLPNDHSTDKRAVDLQDSIDYEDAQLAIKQDKARKKFAKEIKDINPVHKKKAQKRAKDEYERELKEKGLKDPYALEKSNREAWKKAQAHAEVLRNDY